MSLEKSTDRRTKDNMLRAISSPVIDPYDYLDLSYNASNQLTGIVYKQGGSGGTTIATATLTYDASGNLDDLTVT